MPDSRPLPGESWVEWRARWREPKEWGLRVWTQSAYYSFSEMQARLSQLPDGTETEVTFRVCTVTATDWIKHE
jgi:hypothetical protein